MSVLYLQLYASPLRDLKDNSAVFYGPKPHISAQDQNKTRADPLRAIALLITVYLQLNSQCPISPLCVHSQVQNSMNNSFHQIRPNL